MGSDPSPVLLYYDDISVICIILSVQRFLKIKVLDSRSVFSPQFGQPEAMTDVTRLTYTDN